MSSNRSAYVDSYRLRTNLDTTATDLLNDIELTPRYLTRLAPGNDLRVSGVYTVISDIEEVFALHDFKNTSVWDADLPTPDAFWSSEEPVELSADGEADSDFKPFAAWPQSNQSHRQRLSQ